MCHPSVLTWAAATITREMCAGMPVLEVGSQNVNGSVRPLVESFGPASYTGTDVRVGAGVDHVINADTLTRHYGLEHFGLVISTEMLEHTLDWHAALWNMALVLAPRGHLVLTTRSHGFPYHYPPDFWRYPPRLISQALNGRLGLDVPVCVPDPDHPGVFAVAVKPSGWQPPPRNALSDLKAEPMPQEAVHAR